MLFYMWILFGQKEIVKAKRIWIYCLGIIGFLLTVLISIWSSRIKGEPYGAFLIISLLTLCSKVLQYLFLLKADGVKNLY